MKKYEAPEVTLLFPFSFDKICGDAVINSNGNGNSPLPDDEEWTESIK